MPFFSSVVMIILSLLSLLTSDASCQNSTTPSTTNGTETHKAPGCKLNSKQSLWSIYHYCYQCICIYISLLIDDESLRLLINTIYICVSLNTISIIFVLVRLYLKWHFNKRKFSMALKVPLYLGLLGKNNLLYMRIHNNSNKFIHNNFFYR